ncbi:type II toxin-antitoxin system PemK/MazF family toxin [Parvibaculum sp.]|uniref:type II toxin-antitoxin system PemK/MazF family toxin n=1 Tax=Parvibaculum sp. TaxID=2024848 RepID=UPI0034A07AC9
MVLCDYALGGFRKPEMIKKRPAVVISPRLPYRDSLCTVVPLSGTAPNNKIEYQRRIELEEALPHPFPLSVWWAKCDMLATVGFQRLDLFRTERMVGGKRKYIHPKLSAEQIAEVHKGVLFAIGLGSLTRGGQ